MPSRIARLYVDNYRCFVNFELRPERRSLLLGDNGSGKSSVFDVLWAISSLIRANADTKDVFPTDAVAKFGGSIVLHTTPDQSVLCLDEPENFVSIGEIQPFLTELADLSDETGIQVLLISHSPEVIDYVGASGAILLERPEGGHTRVRSVEATGPLRLSERMARGWLTGGSDGAS